MREMKTAAMISAFRNVSMAAMQSCDGIPGESNWQRQVNGQLTFFFRGASSFRAG
jgi:hypothetical protein